MIKPTFKWDPNKEKNNYKKHGIHFNEATTVFFDENAIEYYDPDHSNEEDRFFMLGVSSKLRTLIVCHCYRKNNLLIRIISARKATKKEEKHYYRSLL